MASQILESAKQILLLLAISTLISTASATAEVKTIAGLKIAPDAPWGKLVKTSICLEAPERLVKMYPSPSTSTCWCLAPANLDKLKALFTQSSVAKEQWEPMFTDKHQLKLEGEIAIYPSPQLVLDLPATLRTAIYKLISLSQANEYFHAPLVVTSGKYDQWLRGSALPTTMMPLFKQLIWSDGPQHYFSDPSLLMSQCQNPTQHLAIMKLMTRTQAVVAHLEISAETDITALQAYWRAGRIRTDVEPLLASLQPTEPGTTSRMDLVHLLPPFVRKLLYAYPDLNQGISGRFPDCHWTSLNFLEPAIKDYYIDTNAASKELLANYTRVTDHLRLGDIILFRNGDQGLHSCVYVADDLVFTKNGSNLVHPWVLSELSDVVDTYHDIPNLALDILRKSPETKN